LSLIIGDEPIIIPVDMPNKQIESVRYCSFNLLDQEGIFNAVITRHGGVSPAPWDSLNLGGTVGDEHDRVTENRQLLYNAFRIDGSRIFDVWQVHSAEVVTTREPRHPKIPHQKADAILTDQSDIFLLMRFADCVPILLYDPIQKVIGLVHAGWKGTVGKVVGRAVQKMCEIYKVIPSNIIAGIGPSIGPDHYTVGKDVIDEVVRAFGTVSKEFLFSDRVNIHLDMWACNRWILEQGGVQKIENLEICTACHLDDWYSHRAEHGRTGRFGAMIGMRG
jgi:polyphenol oxidase